MQNHIRSFAIALTSLSLLLVSQIANAQTLDRIVAVVDEDIVLESELEQFVSSIRRQSRQSGQRLPPPSQLRSQALERLIINRLQVGRAKRAGMDVTNAQLTDAAADIARRNNQTLQQFINELEKNGTTYAQFRRDLNNEILVQRLRSTQVDARVSVSEREIEDALAVAASSAGDAEFRINHIMVEAPKSLSADEVAEQEAKIKDIQQRLKEGADFSQTAVAFSDGQRALEGGDLGWRQLNQLPTIFIEPTKKLSPGDVSEIIRSPSGFHLIKLSERRDPNQLTLNERKIRHILIKTTAVKSTEEARVELANIRDRITSGEDFSKLAKTYSDDPGSAKKGGDLGWVKKGVMVPEFENTAFSIEQNQLSQLVESQFGWHLIIVDDVRQRDASAEMLRNKVRQQIYQRKLAEETEAWSREMRDRSFVEIRL